MSRAERAQLFAHATHLKARTARRCAYALGLRLSERCALRLEHFDAAADRICVRMVQGKGAKDRYVSLPNDLWIELAQYRRRLKPRRWPFAAATDVDRPSHRSCGCSSTCMR